MDICPKCGKEHELDLTADEQVLYNALKDVTDKESAELLLGYLLGMKEKINQLKIEAEESEQAWKNTEQALLEAVDDVRAEADEAQAGWIKTTNQLHQTVEALEATRLALSKVELIAKK